jgi:hypothetical protein
MDEELKQLLQEMRQENAAAHAETRQHAEQLFGDTRRHSETLAAETRQHSEQLIGDARRHLEILNEATRHEVQLVAEKVLQLDEKLDREAADIRAEMRQGFADTQAMYKFSHAELDRRMRTLEESNRSLEEGLANLQARVERLESSTH